MTLLIDRSNLALRLLAILLLASNQGVLFAQETSSADVASPSSKAELANEAEHREWLRCERLLEQGCELNAVQPDGMTALHWAVRWGNVELTSLLLSAGADANSTTRYQITPLAIACTNGDAKIVSLLLDAGAKVNTKLQGGETMLMRAARTGNPETVKLLIQRGAKVNEKERHEQTALMWAAAAGNTEVVQILLEAGADIHATLPSGFTAMLFAAREGRLAVCQKLLAAGVDVNAAMQPKRGGERAPRKGMSALLLAVESGHFELACCFIESGADPNDQRSGYAPLHALSWVRKANRGENAAGDPEPRGSGNLTSLAFVRMLVELGADVNLRLQKGKGQPAEFSHRGATPFLLAASTADLPLMKLLVDLGADPLQTNIDGCTPLMTAAGVGVVAVGEEAGTEPEVIAAARYLLEAGIDVNDVDKNGETAMHGAAYRNFPRVVELLAERGADPTVWNRKNKYGWTPVMIAQGHRPGSLKPSPKTVAALQTAMR